MSLDIFKVILLGIVEGITEWLPISSTGHLILLEEFLTLETSEEFKEMFQVVVQLGAIFAVIILYFQRLNPFSRGKIKEERISTCTLWMKVIVACIPAGLLGILLDEWLETHLYNYVVVAMMLIIYGVFFVICEKKIERPMIYKSTNIDFQTAFFIGIFQALSLVPGTSRSGATILGAMFLGVSRCAATEFTFYMAIPVMFGASAVKFWKFFSENGRMLGEEVTLLVVGCVVAFIVSVITIKSLLSYIKNNNFERFGYYRIVLGILVLLYFFTA